MCDHLNGLVGANRVFMDVEDIAPGQRIAQTINDTIAGCDAFLAVIGPRWAEILHKRAELQQRDYVKQEIEAALAAKVTIVPVLVGGATMAELAGLLAHLAPLAQYAAAALRAATVNQDCERLTRSLNLPVGPSPGDPARKSAGRRTAAIAAGIVAIVALLVAGSSWLGIGPWREYRARKTAMAALLATGKTQAERSEYQSAFGTYRELLKLDPESSGALELQLDAAMRWLVCRDVHTQDRPRRRMSSPQ